MGSMKSGKRPSDISANRWEQIIVADYPDSHADLAECGVPGLVGSQAAVAAAAALDRASGRTASPARPAPCPKA